MRKPNLSLLLILFVLISLFAPAGPVYAQDESPGFREGDCPPEARKNIVPGVTVRCGVLTVPLHYDQPDAGTLELDVMIFPAQGEPQPDPIVFAQGGPGGSTIDYFSQVLSVSRIWADRDLILFDQRGTLYSKPNLLCPEILQSNIEILPLDLSSRESGERYNQAALACRDRLISEGVDLSAFNSVENARDIDALRAALGYREINLYGVSYGTLLAQHAMREVPQGLRSVILDAVVPTNIDFNFDATNSQDRAFTALFEACKNDEKCDSEFPNLEQRFFALTEKLNESPVFVTLTDTETSKEYRALINGDALIGSLFQMLYVSEFIPLLPRMVEQMEKGSFNLLAKVLSLLTFDRTMSYGMYFSVVCAEDGLVDPKYSYEGVREELKKDAEQSNAQLVQLCSAWDVRQIGDQADEPVNSDIPVLIFNGYFDPITPPSYGQEVSKTLTNSHLYTFPNTGHGALVSSACADSIFLAFLDDPYAEPDSSCLNSIPPVSFLTDADVIDLPVMMELAMLKGPFVNQAILFGIALVILMTSLLVFPIAWLVNLVRKPKSAAMPQLAYMASWIPPLAFSSFAALTIILFAAMVILVQQDQTSILYFGLPTHYKPVFLISFVGLFLTIAMLAIGAVGITGKFWSRARKAYYALLILAAATCSVFLGLWGLYRIVI